MAMKLQRLRKLCYDFKCYVKYELRDIVLPRSLPDPPEYASQKRAPFSFHRAWQVFRATNREYLGTWRGSKVQASPDDPGSSATGAGEPPLTEDFAAIARGGSAKMRPYLQQLYSTRAMLYRDSLQEFVKGYKEGLQAEGEDADSERDRQTQADNQQLKNNSSAVEDYPK